ncbi:MULTISPECIES: MFS transporter [unclassified Archaeoglobus]|jgi:EmrB/QacA subfamily drug resistance transporter|uniref:MFS transporter n=1 Tax=unclassified Archaeoglobus TaxID=2643606 RepID=UPI0025C63A06|nr:MULTISPECIES: MFS transporter [unclassified Archaeoglobus]
MNIRTAALLAACVSSFLTPFIGSATNVALPSIGREFEVDAITLGWVATSYLLAAGMFSVPFGRIADIKGRKSVFTFGLLTFSTGSILSSFAPSAETLITFRVFQGVGGAMIFATAVAILTSVFPPQERGKAIGINTGAVYTGLSLGPLGGGFLTQNLGWRSVFLVNGILGFLALAIALTYLKGEWADARGEKFDFTGSVIYALMLLFLIYGFSEFSLPFIVLGVFLVVLFVLFEGRLEHPVFAVKLLLSNLTFSLSSLAALLNYAATFAVGFLMSLYLQYIKGFDAQTAGLVLVSQPVVMALFAPIAGWISDRIEPRVVASAGMAITTVSLIMFSTISENTAVSNVISYLMLLGFGIALFSSPNTNAIMSSVEKRFLGIASATVATMRLVGQTMSMALVMLVFSIIIGRVEISPEYYGKFIESAGIAFTIFAGLCFLGIFASLGRGRVRGQK